jgi:UDP-N-acetylmuramate dehydrogenase
MDGTRNVPLASHTTLRVGGPADIFYTVHSVPELTEVLAQHVDEPITMLGGGSNVLVADDGVRGVVVHMKIPGITYENLGEYIHAEVGAGVSWDEFVKDSIAHGYCGLENLSGIPGTVGASPIQNIGAYGTEVEDVIEWVEVFDTTTRASVRMPAIMCAFGYRDSIFKKPEGKKFIVTRVAFRLSKQFTQNIAYKDLTTFFAGKVPSSAHEVRNAVLAIRAKKFPDMATTGTAGSFFKNPLISKDLFATLRETYPDVLGFPAGDAHIKVSLAWILDHVLHLNGVRVGNVSFFHAQPLVLCAHDGARAEEIDSCARDVARRVFAATGITIEREVQMLS